MTLSETPGALKRFRRTPWRFQVTFVTPVRDLKRFVGTLIDAHLSLESGSLTVDRIVFEPGNIKSIQARYALTGRIERDWSLIAGDREEIEELLMAALGDGLEFVFVPEPKPFVIYADHDEYATFYANTKSNLNRVRDELLRKGFTEVRDYERRP